MKSLDMRYRRAEIAIFFCYPRTICLYRVIGRRLSKNPDIQDRAESCQEAIRWNLIQYLWTFEKRFTPLIEHLQEQYPHTLFFKITNDHEKNILEEFLKN